MKKSVVALSLMTMSSVASAAQIDALSDMQLDLSGEAEIQLYKSQTKTDDLEVNLNTFTITLTPSYEVTERLRISVPMGLTNNDGDIEQDDFYVQADIDQAHHISIGRQDTVYADAGIGEDYMFGFTSYVDAMTTTGDQVIKYTYDGNEIFFAGISYLSHSNETGYTSSDFMADGRIGARIEDFVYTLYFANTSASKLTEQNYEFDATYTIGDLSLAAMYGYTSAEQASAADKDTKTYGLTALWRDGGRMDYAVGWANIDEDGSDKVNDFYVNATYYVIDGISLYAEVGFTDDDSQETGYVLGVDLSF